MWTFLVRFILRNRLANLIIIGVLTAIMGYKAWHVELSYEFAKMLPAHDSTSIEYEYFKETFGEDGSVIFIGVQDPRIYNLDEFNDWYDLSNDIKEISGVDEVVSITRSYHLVKNNETHKFDFKPVVKQKPTTQAEVDSIKALLNSLPFYDGLLFNKGTNATIMAITLDKAMLNTKNRISLVNEITERVKEFEVKHNVDVHYSGLPYIRTKTSKKVQDELVMFIILALIIASVALYLFFRSFKAMIFPMLIVLISVIWGLGTISLFGYKITILTGIIPPLLIIIGVENCIFLLNKYHNEFKSHGNKVKSLSRIVHRVGNATFLTNLTTAAGFAAFIVTGNKILVEFGIVASINIMVVFFLSLFLIPIFFSYLAPPQTKHVKHLDNRVIRWIAKKLLIIVQGYRRPVYVSVIAIVTVGVFGLARLTTTGNIVDDIPHRDPLYQDLLFFEKNFKGIMPFEITIDTGKKKGVMKLSTLRKIDKLQQELANYPELSKPMSVSEVVKFGKQAFYNGNASMYSLPSNHEMNFMASYLPSLEPGKKSILNNFVDTNFQTTRISVQMANIGTKDIQRIKEELQPKINAIFNPERYNVTITGTSVVFLKGSGYLVNNLLLSLLLAIGVITILMALLFTSPRMVLISIVPNLIPQILTAAMMGLMGIPIKPSTILIFSIALGISVDNTIHFLSRYRQQLKHNNWNIKESVKLALSETSVSMLYSSVILFFGFIIFTFSTFGGTQALGFLISITLLVAMLSNLIVLPSLLLSLDKHITTKLFKESLLEVLDEEEDIELDDLKIIGELKPSREEITEAEIPDLNKTT